MDMVGGKGKQTDVEGRIKTSVELFEMLTRAPSVEVAVR